MTQITDVLDKNAQVVIAGEEVDRADIEEYGMVSVPSVSAVHDLASALAARSVGVNVPVQHEASAGQVVTAAYKEYAGYDVDSIIDPTILAYMRAAEFAMLTNGDLWQIAQTPLQLGFADELQLSGDEGAVKAAREWLDAINIQQRIAEIWLARQTYGNAYPVILRDSKGEPTGVVVLNSKHVAISGVTGIGVRRFAYVPPEDTYNDILGIASLPSFIVRPITQDWNEARLGDTGVGFALNTEDIEHIYVPKLPNTRYAVPPLARALDDIDARTDLELMQRATIKGFRSQLWVLTVDKPRRGEVEHLRRSLGSDAKTGVLVWSSALEVKQHAPQSLDALLGGEALWSYTMAVYRALGITPRIISGESPMKSGSAGDSETDITVFLDKLMYDRGSIRRFVQRLLVAKFGEDAPRVEMPDIELKIAERIKGILVPMMNFGLPSLRTAMQRAGLNPETEMAQHEQDLDFRMKFIHPYTGFSQAGPSGVTDSPSGGRPPGATDKAPRETAQASAETYTARVMAQFNALVANPTAEAARAFVLRLFALGTIYRREAYEQGYTRNGGLEAIDDGAVEAAAVWDESNLDNFEAALLASVAAGDSLEQYRRRAGYYPEMGWRMAYIAGLFQARTEQGYTHWQRVLNPQGSESGPCPVCIADSKVIHSLGEPFFDHPEGVCGMRVIRFFRGNIPGGATNVPIVSVEGFA